MIHIDIYVPDVDENFEIRCDENVSVCSMCEDVYQILERKIGGNTGDDSAVSSQFWLCDTEGENILSYQKTLKEEKIINGSRLIFL